MPITDAFTGTNGTGIVAYSANWAYVRGGTTNFQIQTNALATANTVAEMAAQRTETPFPATHYAQLLFTASPGAGDYQGPAVRCQGAATQDYCGYEGANNEALVFENDGATWTQLGSAGSGFASGNTVRITANGTTLTPLLNGSTTNTPGAQTAATFSGGAPGVCGFNGNATPSPSRTDDFEATDLDGGGGGRTTFNTVSHPLGLRLGLGGR